MAQSKYTKGEERILFIKVEDDYIPVGCLTSNPLSEETDMLPTTTRQNSGWETSRPSVQRFNLEFEGLQVLTFGDDGDSSKLSYDRLKLIKRNREKIEWKIEDTDLKFIDIGYGYITSISESNAVGEILSFSGSITGFGMPTAASTPYLYLFEDGQPFIFQDTQSYSFNNDI
ncbi:phage tail protein [Cellulophaga phage phi10:1]|uniref:Phage tail protein n=1 Tax=Cellulophaga phage phi10:1 TaxID=1327981 RepID=R9ZYK3_9CAUD|nr:phage tail protein [Cellulophaga phage phi10:1]AGO48429.1 phage tail protein [Cellulophaga phage phi10:1]